MRYASGGIHHITAIARDPWRNVAFYTGVLGLRPVKRTVNFNDPETWHLYYAAGAGGDGAPGTVLSFLAYPGARRGRHGTGQAVEVAFAIPRGSLGYWMDRLAERGVAFELPVERFGERVLCFEDHDGLALELATEEGAGVRPAWAGDGGDDGDVPAEHGLCGLAGVSLWQRDGARAAALLVGELGFVPVGTERERLRLRAGDGGPAGVIDLRQRPGAGGGSLGAGTVHSVTLRARSDAAQAALRRRLAKRGCDVSAVFDLHYFRSLYFREPGGTVLGLANDRPGFAVDEPPGALGEGLMLPPWLEWRRAAIEAVLPPLHRPVPTAAAAARSAARLAHVGG